jgi:ABC-type transport system involved in multi-copper enzyme maturation permease subunit
MMRTLLWKDLKLQRMVLVASLVFYFLPTVVVAVLWSVGNIQPDNLQMSRATAIRQIFGQSLLLGVFMLVLTNTAIASVAAARERRERSAEFLGAMPVPRGMVVASRFLAMMIGVVGCLVVGCALGSLVSSRETVRDASQGFWGVAAVMTSMVGFAWLVGSLVRSEVIATAGALGITVAIALTSESAIDWINKQQPMRVPTAGSEKVTLVVLAVGGVLALVVGVVVALRRKTP